MEDRRSFLKTACKPIVFATLGIPILEACSAEETDPSPIASSSSPTPTSTQKREPIVIDLSNGLFSDLTAVGGWMNYRGEDLLLVRITDDEIRAFDNSCPHQGNRDKWEYDGDSFTCQYHFNSYSNSCTGSLRCFDTNIENGVLTITFD